MKKITELGVKETIAPFKNNWLMKDGTDRKVIHVAGIGKVGSVMLTGLKLCGSGLVKELGLFDLSKETCLRWEMELNQVREAFSEEEEINVRILSQDDLFDCDVFAFCIARAIPEVSDTQKDVRLAQYEANRTIVASYAKMAADAGFKGLFAVVSDPVDLLCREAYRASLKGKEPLHPHQIQGFGLGVMNARAAYYAKTEGEPYYLSEGRVFGPHGQDLVVANSVSEDHFSEDMSDRLKELTVNSNLVMRSYGVRPYVAPALSSAALTLLRVIGGKWNYTANYLNGVWFGAKNRTTKQDVEWEELPLPDALFERIEKAYDHLKAHD